MLAEPGGNMMSDIGVSCMGWRSVDYGDRTSVINFFERASKLAHCIEIPFISFKWIHEVKKKVNQGKINIYSMHLPRQLTDETYETQQQIALTTRYMTKALNIKQVIVHPWNKVVEPETIDKFMSILKLMDTSIAFELTNLEFMEQAQYYNIGTGAGLAVDFSHLMRLSNGTIDLLKTYPINHVHLRGYSSKERYSHISVSLESIKHFLQILKANNYPGKIILEYPYLSYEELYEDLDMLKKIQGENYEILF